MFKRTLNRELTRLGSSDQPRQPSQSDMATPMRTGGVGRPLTIVYYVNELLPRDSSPHRIANRDWTVVTARTEQKLTRRKETPGNGSQTTTELQRKRKRREREEEREREGGGGGGGGEREEEEERERRERRRERGERGMREREVR